MTVGTSRDLAASDTPNENFSWLLVTTGGDITYRTEGGNEITITAAPAGVWFPVGNATNVKTSSTASGFVVA